MGLAEELRVKLADWRHQEAMVHKGAARRRLPTAWQLRW